MWLVWLGLLAVLSFVHYKLGQHDKYLKDLHLKVNRKSTPEEKEKIEKSKSVLVDMEDPIQAAKYEHERMMRELNPQNYDEET